MFVGFLVGLFEVLGFMVDEEGMMKDVGGFEVAVPLLHDLIGPHVESGRVEAEGQLLGRLVSTLHILSYIYLI